MGKVTPPRAGPTKVSKNVRMSGGGGFSGAAIRDPSSLTLEEVRNPSSLTLKEVTLKIQKVQKGKHIFVHF